MPDFTLEDIRLAMREEIQQIVPGMVRGVVQEEFVREREVTRRLVRDELQEQFQLFIEHTFQPALDDIDRRFNGVEAKFDRFEAEMRGLKRVVRAHSADIAELQARGA